MIASIVFGFQKIKGCIKLRTRKDLDNQTLLVSFIIHFVWISTMYTVLYITKPSDIAYIPVDIYLLHY